MVSGSTTSTFSIAVISGRRNEPCMVRWRSKENFAASASSGSPSWNLTFGRSLIVTALPSSDVSWDSASCGTTLSFSSMSKSLSHKRREDDASDIGAGERRVEHVGILGKSDAERRLRARRSDGCRERRGREERGGEASSHVPLPVLFPNCVIPEARRAIREPSPVTPATQLTCRRPQRRRTGARAADRRRRRPAQYRFPSGSSARNDRPWRGPCRRRRAADARGG